MGRITPKCIFCVQWDLKTVAQFSVYSVFSAAALNLFFVDKVLLYACVFDFKINFTALNFTVLNWSLIVISAHYTMQVSLN